MTNDEKTLEIEIPVTIATNVLKVNFASVVRQEKKSVAPSPVKPATVTELKRDRFDKWDWIWRISALLALLALSFLVI